MRAMGLVMVLCVACGESSRPVTPSVAITQPESGALLSQSRVSVRGTAAAVNQIEVNGQIVDVVEGQWSATVLASDGELVIQAQTSGGADSVTVTVDATPPVLVLESPQRGFIAQGESSVRVSGSVQDAVSGVESLYFGGQKVELSNGVFEFDMPLREGVNELSLTAVDRAGNESTALRGGLSGDFVPGNEEVGGAFQVYVDRGGLDTLETVVERAVTGEVLTQFAQSQFEHQSVRVQQIEFDELDVEILTRANSLEAVLRVSGARVRGEFTLGDTAYPTTIEVVQFQVRVPVQISATAEGSLGLVFGTSEIELEDSDIRYDISGLTQDDVSFLQGLIRQVVEYAFANFLSEKVFEQLFDPAILTRSIEVLGQELTFSTKFEEIRVFEDGVLARLSLAMPGGLSAGVREVPGALNRIPGSPAGPNVRNDLLLTTTHQALDRVLHGVWQSGLLHQTFDSAALAGLNVPFQLTAGGLALVLDSRITGLVPSQTPAAVRLRPLLAPVVDLKPDGQVELKLADLMVDLLLLPAGESEKLLASFAFFLDLKVSLSVQNGEIVLGVEPQLRADLAEEPLLDFDDAHVEGLFEDLVRILAGMLFDSLKFGSGAEVIWFSIQNPALETHGESTQDHLTLSAAVEAAEEINFTF